MPLTSRSLRYPAPGDSPNIAQYFQNLANDVNGALVQNWVDDVVSATSYDAPIGALADLPGYNVSVVVPVGRTMDVEFRAPRVEVSATGGVTLVLMVNGVSLDSNEFVCGTSTTQGAFPARLSGAFVGTGAAVVVRVQGVISGNGGRVGGNPVRPNIFTGPRLRHRFV